ncbi:EAL domain-containing protein [Amphritea sp. 1_MG-2023]|uniref:bifunctional diguanylate cyclase/phosphodiesterase n=1 Tax=Amphritea sp. 1_MG-2023 TaxID=3062670 RepID=UPI0026E3CACB|nr:EAL domain-containing protein [Amphritea sp. 1_MG-2023]MDO6564590.1 EAL domain-containing protein [Amphritea sp. 1_MG-2023]
MDFRRFKPTSLHKRVLILTLAGFLLTTLIVTLSVFRYLQNDTSQLLVEQQQIMVDMVTKQIHSELQERVDYLEKFTLILHSREQLHSVERLQQILKQDTHLQRLFGGGVIIVNPQGFSLADYPTVPNRIGLDFSDRQHLQKARQLKATVITEPLIGKGLKSPLFAINTPILSASGNILGFIFGVKMLAQDNLLKDLSQPILNDAGRMMIIDPKLEIYITDTSRGVALESYKDEPYCECIELAKAGIASGITQNTEGDRVIFASARLDNMDWIVIRHYPLKQAMATINTLSTKIVMAILVISLLIAGIIAYLLKKLLTPLTNASRDIRHMAEGKIAMHPLRVDRHDEVGQFLRAFNQLYRNQSRYEQALKDSEERYRLTMEATQTGLWSWDLRDNSIRWDKQCYQMLAYKDQAFQLNKNLFKQLMHPDDKRRFYHDFLPQLLNNHTAEIEFRLLTSENKWLWVKSRGKPIRFANDKQPLIIAGTHINFEKQKQTEQLRLAAAAFESNDAIMIVDSENHIIKVNSAFSHITGYSAEEVIGHSPAILRSGVHKASFYEAMQTSLKDSGKWAGEIWNRHKNGTFYIAWMNINTRLNDDHTVNQYIATFADITEKKRTEELIWNQANFDPLTNLPNRRMFMDRLTQEIRLAARSQTSLALLFIDLDQFKEINDTLGHHIGDQLLLEVAARFKHLIRSSDTVSRLGGDEFTLILPQIENSTQVAQVAEKLLTVLQQPFELDHQRRFISASIGIALYPQDSQDTEQLIQHADQAMYAAKAAGRARFHFYTSNMTTLSHKRTQLINDLQHAINEHQFQLYYQPIISLQDMRVAKAEALIRWHHPNEGVMFPHQFMQTAEENGLTLPLGDFIFRQALHQVKRWQQQLNPQLQVCINASPAHFETQQDEHCAYEQWLQIAQTADISPTEISIWITEHLLMDASSQTQQKIAQLRDANIQVGLDDFGTRFSSLAQLKRMKIDYLKIDRSFIRNLHSASDDMTLCNAIIVMAHTLGLKVIAEGVETEEQHQLMLQANCDFGQGFFYASAMTVEQFEHWHRTFQPA